MLHSSLSTFLFSLFTFLFTVTAAFAQDSIPNIDLNAKDLQAHKECKGIVYENPKSPLIVNTDASEDSKAFGTDLWRTVRTNYASTLTGLVGEISTDAISATIDFLKEAFRSKKNDWEKMVKEDCTFELSIPVDEPIKDFYGNNSNRGAMDPDGIIFDGFGCRQTMTITQKVNDTTTINREIPIIDIKCSLRKDSVGMARMAHHGKFEVVLDYVKINPYLCNIPNVEMPQEELDALLAFDFAKRNNFKLSINAIIKSSWINEAILLNQDKELGSFRIDISIPDSTYLQYDGNNLGYFVYERPGLNERTLSEAELQNNKRAASRIKVSGESFLVPRTFIGYDDNNRRHKGVWGTGMYSVELSLKESCDINKKYYLDERKSARKNRPCWNDNWSKEWRVMKHRRHRDIPYNSVWRNLKMKYEGDKWINTIVSPATSFILKYESDNVRKHINRWMDVK